MKQVLLKFSWFRNWLADTWEDGWEQGETWSDTGGIGVEKPVNPFLRGWDK